MTSHLELHLGLEILDPNCTMAQLGLGRFPTFDMSTNVSVLHLELGVFNSSCPSAPHLEARKTNYSCASPHPHFIGNLEIICVAWIQHPVLDLKFLFITSISHLLA
jgi:hypothetical protein